MGVILECVEPVIILHLRLAVGYSVLGKWTLYDLGGALSGGRASHQVPTWITLRREIEETLIEIREFAVSDVIRCCVVCGKVCCDRIVRECHIRIVEEEIGVVGIGEFMWIVK